MQPKNLPIVCLPLDLSDEAAATFLEFLYELTSACENHYAPQILRHQRSQRATDRGPPPSQDAFDDNSF